MTVPHHIIPDIVMKLKKVMPMLVITLTLLILSGCHNSHPSTDENYALALSDTAAMKAIVFCDSVLKTSNDADCRARIGAIRAYARYRAGYDDTIDRYLDTTAIIRLRNLGSESLPFLTRGLYAFAQMAYNRSRYQSALNLSGESAYRALAQESDTFIAARAYKLMGRIYSHNHQSGRNIGVQTKAAALFNAIGDRYNRDYARMRIAASLAINYDSAMRVRAIKILDSITNETDGNSDYREELDLNYFNLEPRLNAGQYEATISYGKDLLRKSDATKDDSLWAYAHITKAYIRMKRMDSARHYLDRAQQFSGLVTRGSDRGTVSLTRLELDFIDSMSRETVLSHVGDLISRYSFERDTIVSLTGRYTGDIDPQFPTEIPFGHINLSLWIAIIVSVFIIASILLCKLYRKNQSLEYRQKLLKTNLANVSLHADALGKELNKCIIEYDKLEIDIENQKANNEMIAQALKEQCILTDEKERMLQSIRQLLAPTTTNLAIGNVAGLGGLFREKNRWLGRLFRVVNRVEAEGATKSVIAEIKLLSKYFISETFTSQLEAEMSWRFNDWDTIAPQLQKLLQVIDYKILLLFLAGYDVTVICFVVGLRKSAIYTHRETIISLISNSENNSINEITNLITKL